MGEHYRSRALPRLVIASWLSLSSACGSDPSRGDGGASQSDDEVQSEAGSVEREAGASPAENGAGATAMRAPSPAASAKPRMGAVTIFTP
jgi:hypothetical protein